MTEDEKAAALALLGEPDLTFEQELQAIADAARDAPSRAVACELCRALGYAGTKRCNRCWELERKILYDAPLARKILDRVAPDEAGRIIREAAAHLKNDAPSKFMLAVAALRDIADQPPTFGTDCRSGDQKSLVAEAALEKMGVPELEAIYDENDDVVGWK